MGDGHGGIDKVASSWTLRGWSPLWTRATVTLRVKHREHLSFSLYLLLWSGIEFDSTSQS